MKHLLTVAWFSLWSLPTLGWATQALYVNNSPLRVPPDIAPNIDAIRFVNQSEFSISVFTFPSFPFQTLNTLYFTNTPSGVMSGSPGFRFDFFTNNLRLMMDSWVNQGSVSADTWLMVSATNLLNSGALSAGPGGLVRLESRRTNRVARAGLRTGLDPRFGFSDGFTFGSNYVNAAGVTDIYWGLGTNNAMNNQGQPMVLAQQNLAPPCPQSPPHQVVDTRFGFSFTNTVRVPSFGTVANCSFAGLPGYHAFVYTNQINPTNFAIQVAFVPTNSPDANLRTQVRFYPDFFDGGATVIVEFSSFGFDISTQTSITNNVYLLDSLAFTTNVFAARLQGGGNARRPNTYEIRRNTPFEFLLGNPANAVFTNTLFFNPGNYSSNLVNLFYTAYAANISALAATNLTGGASADPTNLPGRVEIIGDVLDLEQTRIRSESTIIIKARSNLVNNALAMVDAPFCNFELTSQQSPLVISNLVPPTVQRFSGDLYAWSAIWNNYETNDVRTNLLQFHVLVVENQVRSGQSVVVNEFIGRATDLVLHDVLNIGQSLLLDARSLQVVRGLNLPFGAGWSATNAPRLLHFTNDGQIFIPQAGIFGSDRPSGYASFINRGTNQAASLFLRSSEIQNPGALVASDGLLSVEAVQMSLLGPPTISVTNVFINVFTNFFGQVFTNIFTNIVTTSERARLQANGDLRLLVGELTASNSTLQAGTTLRGALVLSVTNRLADLGLQGPNTWRTTAGFELSRRPAQGGDLMATHLLSTAPRFAEVFHRWAADDLGPTARGFSNNVAVGRLTLDGDEFSRFRFQPGPGQTNRALYVDFLELLNYATNFTTALVFEPDLTIYFANANLPVNKLHGVGANPQGRGGFRWVPEFAGPNSSTNLVYPSGRVHTFNLALVMQRDRDDDGDGIANADDPTPIFTGEQVGLRILLTGPPGPAALLSWTALFDSLSFVEYSPTLPGANWQVLGVLTNGPFNQQLTTLDPIGTAQGQRYYRVRVQPPPLR